MHLIERRPFSTPIPGWVSSPRGRSSGRSTGWTRSRRRWRAPLGTPHDLPGPAVLGFLACASIVRRAAFLASGGFDPVVFFMGEETRLAYDLHAAGWGLAYCPDVVAHHHPGPPAPGGGKARLAARNRVLTAWMRRPLPVALAETARLDRHLVGEVLRRLPMALRRRRPPNPAVEAAVARVTAAGGS
jgi:GT2 family glycosyltransferase